jgi:hypothetical protein
MKKIFKFYLIIALSLPGHFAFCQTEKEAKPLGLPGDNLDLYAVLSLFQKSKTIEDFEKSLNAQKTGINNLDLDLDKKVDFIKVVTKKDGDSFTFILEVAVSKTESQDVAVIIVDKDKSGKVSMQIVGDEALYGKNYVIEPKTTATAAVTSNPGYVGSAPVASAPATTTVVIETVPIVQYVYSPVYVPYYPPYHYGYYPPYFAAFTVLAVGIYRHNNYYHHSGYYGGHYHSGNTVIINNKNTYNNYNNNKMRSATVTHNTASGRYNLEGTNKAANHPAAGTSNRAVKSPSAATRQETGSPSHVSKGAGASTMPSGGASKGNLTRNASTTRAATHNASTGAGRARTSGGGGRRR